MMSMTREQYCKTCICLVTFIVFKIFSKVTVQLHRFEVVFLTFISGELYKVSGIIICGKFCQHSCWEFIAVCGTLLCQSCAHFVKKLIFTIGNESFTRGVKHGLYGNMFEGCGTLLLQQLRVEHTVITDDQFLA